jgi:cathepsin L
VATVGPVSIIMRAEESFYNYESGIYNVPTCGKEGNHCMLLVGYGTDSVQGDYWLLKNSWGEFHEIVEIKLVERLTFNMNGSGDSWGELGYVKMARNAQNMCNIAHSATVS